MSSWIKDRAAVSSVLTHFRLSRAAHARRAALARDLATFDTPADLLDLSAMLDRYSDQDTAELRAAVRWDRAA